MYICYWQCLVYFYNFIIRRRCPGRLLRWTEIHLLVACRREWGRALGPTERRFFYTKCCSKSLHVRLSQSLHVYSALHVQHCQKNQHLRRAYTNSLRTAKHYQSELRQVWSLYTVCDVPAIHYFSQLYCCHRSIMDCQRTSSKVVWGLAQTLVCSSKGTQRSGNAARRST